MLMGQTQGGVVTELLEQLIAINSANPATQPGGPGEREIAAFCQNWLEARGVLCETVLAGEDGARPSVIAISRGNKPGRHLVLAGHLDTHSWYEPQPSDGSGGVHGPGAFDMKAGIAVMMWTMRALARRGHGGEVTALLLADEEHRSIGLHAVVPRLHADAAIVLEGTGLQLGVRHGGRVRITIDFATREERDALLLELALRSRRGGPLRDGVRFATVDHGVWRAVLQRKLSDGEDPDGIAECILDEVTALSSPTPYVDVRPPFVAQEFSSLVAVVWRNAREHGITTRPVSIPGWTEAATLASYGMSTLVFGPGGGGAHTPKEWVDAAQTEKGASILLDAVLEYCELS